MKEQRIEIGKKISANLKAERNRKSLTQADVSKQLNISIPTYARYEENGSNIPISVLFDISNIFNCNIDNFFVGIKDHNMCD